MSGVSIGTVDGAFITAISVNMGTATSNSVVAAVAGQTVRVYKVAVSSLAAGQITFQDGTTALTGPIPLAAGVPLVMPMDGNPWLTCSVGNALRILESSATPLAGAVWFTQG